MAGTDEFDVDLVIGRLNEGDEMEFNMTVYKYIMSGCRHEVKVERVANNLLRIADQSPLGASLVADILATIDQEIDSSNSNSADGVTSREAYTNILRICSPLMGCLLQERLETETLFEAGIVTGNLKVYNTRFIRIKTKAFYKQQKFNLLREESEGYAKLLSELCRSTSDSDPHVIQVVQCLIGRFNLDPNRVLEIILQAFECQPDCNFFVTLLEKLKSPVSTICELLGSRFSACEIDCQSLFILTAHLLQHRIITVEAIYPWLTPNDRAIHRQWARELSDAKEYARKSMVVSINKAENTEEQEEIRPNDDLYFDNQKFCLCEALISVGAWEEADNLMSRLPEFCCVSNRRIACRLIELIEYMIRPLYTRISSYVSKDESTGNLAASNPKLPKQIHTYLDFSKNYQLILALGPYIHYRPELIYKLLRIMTHFLEKRKDCAKSPLYFQQITILDQVILPALCFLDANCSLSEEIWGLLKLYPYEHRFRLYGAWKGETIVLLHPTLLRRRVDVVKKVKHLMRRISKENVKLMGRNLGKLSHSMPAVVFDYLLSQIQLFDNLIMPVIDALKFLTSLSYDILEYCLLEALTPSSNKNVEGFSVMLMPNRSRTKHDGSTIAPWLQSLASFTGAICKKYPLELVPLLQYIANQLKCKQSLDLLLLKEIVQKMTGIEAAEEMTSEQLDAMGGGELLRGEAGYFGQVRTAKKSATRLREASSVNDLAVTLCLLMAQQRDCIIYNESSKLHTKLVGKLYDQCQDTLVQFGSFLAVSCTLDDYAKKIPPILNLVNEYHVGPDVAYFLWRPLFAHAIQTKYDELRRAAKSHKNLTISQRHQKYAEAANIILDPIADTMKTYLPAKTFEDISPQFFVTFWSLTLYDLFVPTDAYNREVNRIKSLSNAATENKDMASAKRKKEQERCNALIEKLHDEKKRQKEHVERVMAKLNKEKDTWFASRTAKSAKNEAVTAFLQHCLFPRCIFTAPDALYCAHFVNIIHSLSTPNFSTLICYDRIFCDIIYTVTSCSENEANRYGRFLCALLGTIMKWHGNKTVFDKECASFPGFITKFRAANAIVTESSDHVEYENYRHVCHKWHYKITKCVIVCLESNDFTQIRNSLIVLKRILPHYPRVLNLANAVERWIERVRTEQKDKRQDLFALGTSYIGQLKSRWGTLVAEEDFHIKTTPDKPVTEPAKNVEAKLSQDELPKAKSVEAKLVKSSEATVRSPDLNLKSPNPRNKPVETKQTSLTAETNSKNPELKIKQSELSRSSKTSTVVKQEEVKSAEAKSVTKANGKLVKSETKLRESKPANPFVETDLPSRHAAKSNETKNESNAAKKNGVKSSEPKIAKTTEPIKVTHRNAETRQAKSVTEPSSSVEVKFERSSDFRKSRMGSDNQDSPKTATVPDSKRSRAGDRSPREDSSPSRKSRKSKLERSHTRSYK